MLNSFKDKIVATVDKATKEGKVYIFLTPSGAYFSLLIFILFIISLSYGNSLAYLCSFLFLSVTWVSCIVTNYNLYGLDFLKLEKDDFFIEGEAINANIYFKNVGKKVRFDIEANILDGKSDFSLEVNPGEVKSVFLELPSRSRGIYNIKKLDIRTSFPFGLFRSWKPFNVNEEVVVIPRPEAAAFPSTTSHFDSDGQERSRRQREEFSEHGRYTNEEASRIDWKIYARRGELYLKEFDTASVNSYEFNDKSSPANLSYWLLTAQKEGALYSLVIGDKVFSTNNGKEHLLSCLKEVAKL